MRVLIDTNIVLDWLAKREPYFEQSKAVMEASIVLANIDGYLTAHTLSDLFYILRKEFDVDRRKKLLTMLCDNLAIIPEDKVLIKQALSNEMWNDLEDGLQMQCAEYEKLDYIVTRNIKDFKYSNIIAVMPEQLLALLKA